jgi:hypothetical protein
MTVSIIRGPTIDVPTPARRTGGLLDVADVRDGIAWVSGTDEFLSWNCSDAGATTVCVPDDTPAKWFNDPQTLDGIDFVLFLGTQCRPLGGDMGAQADRVFDLREGKGVEANAEANLFSTGVSLGTAGGPTEALGKMERELAVQYAGVGIIHVDYATATVLLSKALIEQVGGKFFTKLGTRVAVGVGYTSGSMYGTGDVIIYRGDKMSNDSPDRTSNIHYGLAERGYVVFTDCVRLKITAIPLTEGA